MLENPLSECDEVVLLAIGILRDDAYGYPNKERVDSETGRKTALAIVPTASYGLERRGFVRPDLGGNSRVWWTAQMLVSRD